MKSYRTVNSIVGESPVAVYSGAVVGLGTVYSKVV
jgi:hypothetical protein